MLTYRLNNCIDCNSIPNLLKQIDCKLTILAKKQYNNIIYDLNYQLDGCLFNDILMYKRILEFKKCNPDYACKYSIEQIAGQVKLLLFK